MSKKKRPAARAPAAQPAAPPPKPARNRWWIGAAAAAIIAAAGLAYYALQPGRALEAPKVVAAAPEPQFVGVVVCAGCHAKETEAWRGSDHDLAMQVADAKSVLGDFSGVSFKQKDSTATFFTRDGKYFVNTEGPDGKRADFEVKYTFGVRPLQQYLLELPGGRLQALGVAWDTRPKAAGGQRWFHLYAGRMPKPGDPLHWTGIDQNWNFQCAECHSTNLRKAYDAGSATFHTTWSELNVACEACHGPGSSHVAWAKKERGSGDYAGKGLALALDERRGAAWAFASDAHTATRTPARASSREIDTCGRCHARAARFSDDYAYGKPGGDAQRRATLDEGLYWSDGQMRDEVYNWGSFLQSRMNAQGVTCSDCHDPHSLKLRATGNAVCTQCHAASAFDTNAHTHHAPGTAGAACASCHMPTTTYMVVDPRHDHSLRIPRPDLTVKLGVPNACNACHDKQSAQWAADAVKRLWGDHPPRGYQQFAEALAAGTAGAKGARGGLLTLVDDPSQPAIVRASALARLGPFLTPTAIASVARALNDPDSIVRMAAVGALSNADAPTRARYLPRMLSDPARVVRMDAALALAGQTENGLAPDARAAFARALDEYVAAQNYNADRPEGHANLGNLYARRSDAEHAIAEYRKAIAIDPTFVPAYVNLADLYRARGVDSEAEKAAREGIARNPQAAALYYALGLTLVREKRAAEGLASLAEAARLAPDDARFAYVYAVGLNDAGQPAKSRQALEAAHKRHPYDRDTLEALALYAAHDRRAADALAYAKQLRDLDPENPQYARMAQELERPDLK
jgi:predicted CXXCH cytochrome family protein